MKRDAAGGVIVVDEDKLQARNRYREWAGDCGWEDGQPRSAAADPRIMRISGGVARGITLAVPKGDAVRPATDGMRQAAFSSLGGFVEGARFLDLFAGSGAYGLEALSRGAAGGVFVENNAKAIGCIRRNLAAVCKSLGRDESGIGVLQMDALGVPLAGHEVPDLVFVDPPYELIQVIAPALFTRLTEVLAPKPGAVVLMEMPGEIELAPEGWICLKRLGKGSRQPTVAFFRRRPSVRSDPPASNGAVTT